MMVAILTTDTVAPIEFVPTFNTYGELNLPGYTERPNSLYDVASLENDITYLEDALAKNPGSAYYASELAELREDRAAIPF